MLKDSVFWLQTFVLDRVHYYVFWVSAVDDDSLDTIAARDGTILVARDSLVLVEKLARLSDSAVNRVVDTDVDPELRCVNFDVVLRDVKRSPRSEAYGEVLDAWNLLDDVLLACGRPMQSHGRLAETAYDKLFWGLNLPSVTPEGEEFHPVWRHKEWRKVGQLMLRGVSRLREEIHRSESYWASGGTARTT